MNNKYNLEINYQPPVIIAELGCTHGGSLEKAKELVNLAKICGVNFVKFQKRTPRECVPKELWNKSHENKLFSYGDTYLQHRENLELDLGEHYELKKYCENIGVNYSTSVFDITSAKEIIELNPKYIKVPSCCNTHWKMIDILLSEYKGDIHISLGMTSQDERDEIARYLSPYKDRIVAYLCTSQYPTPFENVHLLELLKMKDIYKTLGYSGHGYGIATPVISYVLGCTYVESHFVYDRTAPFTDASSSLEPDVLRRLCRDLRNIQKTLTFKPYDISKEELHQAKKLRYYEKI